MGPFATLTARIARVGTFRLRSLDGSETVFGGERGGFDVAQLAVVIEDGSRTESSRRSGELFQNASPESTQNSVSDSRGQPGGLFMRKDILLWSAFVIGALCLLFAFVNTFKDTIGEQWCIWKWDLKANPKTKPSVQAIPFLMEVFYREHQTIRSRRSGSLPWSQAASGVSPNMA